MTIRSGDASEGNIFFSDADSGSGQYVGIFRYDHNSNFMSFGVNGSERLRIDSVGKLIAGASSTSDTSEMLLIASAGSGDHCGIGIKVNNNVLESLLNGEVGTVKVAGNGPSDVRIFPEFPPMFTV